MLGLFLIYFIGKYFYDLAEDHNRSKWGYAIFGVITYYFGTFIGGILLVILLGVATIEEMGDFLIGLIALPFGIALCTGLYYLLKRSWEKKASLSEDIIDEIGAN